jgi:UDP-N-acetyl-D-mannosaminuronate dehydrogenase
VESILGNLSGRKIAVLGLTYKPDVDDIRESPALEIAHLLSARGARVAAFDPLAQEVDLQAQRAGSVEEAVRGADALLLLVGHRQFHSLAPESLRTLMKTAVSIDCQHAWERTRWEACGFQFHLLGDGREPSLSPPAS